MEVKKKDNNLEIFNELDKSTGFLGVSVFDIDFALNQVRGRACKRLQYSDMMRSGEFDDRIFYKKGLWYRNCMSEEEMQLFYTELLNHSFARLKFPVSIEVYSRYETEDILIKTLNHRIVVRGCSRERLLSLLEVARSAVIKNQVKSRELNRMDDGIHSTLKHQIGSLGVTRFSLNFDRGNVVAKGYKLLPAINSVITKADDLFWPMISEYKLSLSPSEMFIFYEETLNKIIHDTKLPGSPKLYTDQGKGQVIVKSGMHTINAVSSNIEDLLMIMMRTHRVANRNGLEVKERVLTPRRSK